MTAPEALREAARRIERQASGEIITLTHAAARTAARKEVLRATTILHSMADKEDRS